MARVRFIQSTFLVSHNSVFNFNDEAEINDPDQIKYLVDRELADVLIEEKPKSSKKKKTKKTEKTKEETEQAEE